MNNKRNIKGILSLASALLALIALDGSELGFMFGLFFSGLCLTFGYLALNQREVK